MVDTTVRAATGADRRAVVDVITLAFSSDPMTRWVLRDAASYLAAMPEMIVAFGGRGFDHGSAYCLEGYPGAALWLPPGVEADVDRLDAIIRQHAPRSVMTELESVMDEMADTHPADPHWYLPLIGVDPSRQGQGVGSALMTHALRRVDAEHMPAYLESSNPRNITLYQRHGFEILKTIQFGSSPPLVPMFRYAR